MNSWIKVAKLFVVTSELRLDKIDVCLSTPTVTEAIESVGPSDDYERAVKCSLPVMEQSIRRFSMRLVHSHPEPTRPQGSTLSPDLFKARKSPHG